MSDEVPERKTFATFEKYEEFLNIQQSCLNLDLFESPSEKDDTNEYALFKSLYNILDEYQEQSYLLDPYLEHMVEPVVDCLRSHAKDSISTNRQGSSVRVERLATLLYSYVKCRGHKTIIRFFPHEIADLSIALEFLVSPNGLIQSPTQWALRYVVLIWMSLICMIPFDLVQFDDVNRKGRTALAIESSAKALLGKAGLEREGAALLLARLYTRHDTAPCFQQFLEWSQANLESGSIDVITAIGVLRVICEVIKAGSAEQIQEVSSRLSNVSQSIDASHTLSNNTSVRKYKIKLLSRVVMRLLPGQGSSGRRKDRDLMGETDGGDGPLQQPDIEVPAEVEDALEQLFNALQDKDTVVRWSAAKGIARISNRLPPDFSDQVLETILGLFTIHSISAASLYDLPAIAESTWHGACLACAELARRGLVAERRLPEVIEWLSKALYFDLRKGAHSIGSNVRDAAAYVMWALARSQDPSTLSRFAESIAQRLVAVALYDREIHIRRAASAAFQEHVGRNNLFPHGIDVLGKTDFYAVSIRRNAFLTAAPQIAQHQEYRLFLMNHILDITLRHWDPSMRELGSQSLRALCLRDLDTLGPIAIDKSIRLLDSIDVSDLHGGLSALSEIAIAYLESGNHGSQEARMREIFRSLSHIPFDVLTGPRNGIVTAASCRLISITLTLPEIRAESTSIRQWRQLVDFGLKHRTPFVQEAAAEAIRTLSRLADCSDTIKRSSLGTLLGAIDYSGYPNALTEVVQCLLEFVKPCTPPKSNVEARRNCYAAISRIISTLDSDVSRCLSAEAVISLLDCLLHGLHDYSTDQRGDVGSWIRIACVRSLANAIESLVRNARTITAFETYLPPALFCSALAGILKQGVERLDNVRQEAGECFLRLLYLPLPDVENPRVWELPGSTLLKSLFGSGDTNWNQASWLFPKAVRLLEIFEYRHSILSGLVFCLGSKTDSTHRPLAASIVSYAESLPVVDEDAIYDLNTLVNDLINLAKSNLASNATVIPVLQTFNVFLEGDALTRLSDNARGLQSLHLLVNLVGKNISQIKNTTRVQECMKILVNLLRFPYLFETSVSKLVDFLGHQYPSVRSTTAEFLYIFLQGTDLGIDTDAIEEVLLETEWTSPEILMTGKAGAQIVDLFLNTHNSQ